MRFHEINNCEIMIFKLYINHNKYDMIKIDNQAREKSQALSQVLE